MNKCEIYVVVYLFIINQKYWRVFSGFHRHDIGLTEILLYVALITIPLSLSLFTVCVNYQ